MNLTELHERSCRGMLRTLNTRGARLRVRYQLDGIAVTGCDAEDHRIRIKCATWHELAELLGLIFGGGN